jgi:prepilin-type processing-associated H-X9-DG protein
LVVIAIIGILAAMVFPVFARARESARKAVCLSNVKNIALAIQMYLADNNDTFPPGEHGQNVRDYFGTAPGGGDDCRVGEDNERVPWKAHLANPYLRWPVILDEYVKNRDVYRCPSAKVDQAAAFIYGIQDWLLYLQVNEGNWGDATGVGPCEGYMNMPAGWGGDVTDSILQQSLAAIDSRHGTGAGSSKTFVQNIGVGEENFRDRKLVEFQDVTHVPVCADSGMSGNFLSVANMAYPDLCCTECAGIVPWSWTWGGAAAGITDCPNGDWCMECYEMHAPNVWYDSNGFDDEAMKASTRHLGGSNVGWADGHASWVQAQRLCSMADEEEIEGVGTVCGPWGTSVEGYRASCGEPPTGSHFHFSQAIDWYGKDTIK